MDLGGIRRRASQAYAQTRSENAFGDSLPEELLIGPGEDDTVRKIIPHGAPLHGAPWYFKRLATALTQRYRRLPNKQRAKGQSRPTRQVTRAPEADGANDQHINVLIMPNVFQKSAPK